MARSMHDVWYDLIVRELSELTDVATEIRKDAEAAAGPAIVDDEEAVDDEDEAATPAA